MGMSQKRSKNACLMRGLYTIITKSNILWESAKTKEKGFLGAVNCGKVKYGGTNGTEGLCRA